MCRSWLRSRQPECTGRIRRLAADLATRCLWSTTRKRSRSTERTVVLGGRQRAHEKCAACDDHSMAADDFCYVTTTGRRTGRPHRIEIWYAADGNTLYLLSGGGRGSDWVQNAIADPA